MKKLCFLTALIIFLNSCIHSGPVRSELRNAYPSRSEPKEFQSPLVAINELHNEVLNNEKSNTNAEAKSFQKKVLRTLIAEQNRLEKALEKDGIIQLTSGKSYSFELESFCVNAGKDRPIAEDGHRLGPIKGPAQSWLPQLLKKYKNSNIKQPDAQNLVWSLLSGSRFDELSTQQKANILKIFPDAPLRFGVSKIEQPATSFLQSLLPSEINQAKDKFYKYRSLLNDASSSYRDITQVLAPISSRSNPIPMGWIQTKEGYFAKAESINGYSSVRVDLFVPPTITTPVTFDPTNFIAIPAESQRLAISSNKLQEEYRKASNQFLNTIAGRELTDEEQDLIRKHPIDAVKVAMNMKEAFKNTSKYYPNTHPHNTKADAFRHFVWSAMNARDMGIDRARAFAEAHEMDRSQPQNEKTIDTWNNNQGLEYGNAFPSASDEDIAREGDLRVKRRDLKLHP